MDGSPENDPRTFLGVPIFRFNSHRAKQHSSTFQGGFMGPVEVETSGKLT